MFKIGPNCLELRFLQYRFHNLVYPHIYVHTQTHIHSMCVYAYGHDKLQGVVIFLYVFYFLLKKISNWSHTHKKKIYRTQTEHCNTQQIWNQTKLSTPYKKNGNWYKSNIKYWITWTPFIVIQVSSPYTVRWAIRQNEGLKCTMNLQLIDSHTPWMNDCLW